MDGWRNNTELYNLYSQDLKYESEILYTCTIIHFTLLRYSLQNLKQISWSLITNASIWAYR